MSGDQALDRVRREVLNVFAGRRVDVWLFGSWATGQQGRTSDIDVAIDPHEELPRQQVALLRERLEELPVPWPIDVVDLRDAGPEFRAKVRLEGILWNA